MLWKDADPQPSTLLRSRSGKMHIRGYRSKHSADKFEQPYKPPLDAGVKFYASRVRRERYYTFQKGDASFLCWTAITWIGAVGLAGAEPSQLKG
jgi:hypothetical protein